MSLLRALADATGKGKEYRLLERFRALPPHLQEEIVQFGKSVYERWSGGLLPPGPMNEAELYRLYRQLPPDQASRVRGKGQRVYNSWVKSQEKKPSQ